MAGSTLHGGALDARRPFAIAVYTPTSDGVLAPALPSRCLTPASGSAACRLRIDHRRSRKTGPGFPLTVMRCAVHRAAFTLYPPGHVPHGRVAIAPMSPSAELLVPGDGPPDAPTRRLEPDWRVTVFEAAIDAADGHAWSRNPLAVEPRRWRTQLRRIALGACVLGLTALADQRNPIADALGVSPVVLGDAAKAFARAPGYVDRGRSVRDLLGRIPVSRRIGEQLLRSGSLSGRWGEPLRCDPRSGQFVPRPLGRAPP